MKKLLALVLMFNMAHATLSDCTYAIGQQDSLLLVMSITADPAKYTALAGMFLANQNVLMRVCKNEKGIVDEQIKILQESERTIRGFLRQ